MTRHTQIASDADHAWHVTIVCCIYADGGRHYAQSTRHARTLVTLKSRLDMKRASIALDMQSQSR